VNFAICNTINGIIVDQATQTNQSDVRNVMLEYRDKQAGIVAMIQHERLQCLQYGLPVQAMPARHFGLQRQKLGH
jgi:hypothetical protein